VKVSPRPTVAILATGSELVEISKRPLPAQIRNSNSYALSAQVLSAGASFGYLGIAEDSETSLAERIGAGLTADVLLISGGVSVGERDLVPLVLAKAGVEVLFYKVAMKPGKPLLCGRKGECLVFALPGNPVSTFVAFEVFVRPVLAHLMANPLLVRETVRAELTREVLVSPDRTWFAPAWVTREPGGRLSVAPVKSQGSANIAALTRANCLIVFEPGLVPIPAGTQVDAMLLDKQIL
jgi:molybdopterin molybdotransferase